MDDGNFHAHHTPSPAPPPVCSPPLYSSPLSLRTASMRCDHVCPCLFRAVAFAGSDALLVPSASTWVPVPRYTTTTHYYGFLPRSVIAPPHHLYVCIPHHVYRVVTFARACVPHWRTCSHHMDLLRTSGCLRLRSGPDAAPVLLFPHHRSHHSHWMDRITLSLRLPAPGFHAAFAVHARSSAVLYFPALDHGFWIFRAPHGFGYKQIMVGVPQRVNNGGGHQSLIVRHGVIDWTNAISIPTTYPYRVFFVLFRFSVRWTQRRAAARLPAWFVFVHLFLFCVSRIVFAGSLLCGLRVLSALHFMRLVLLIASPARSPPAMS